MAATEFDLIRHYLTGLGARRDDVRLGVGDDAALLQAPSGQCLAMSTDTLVAGVHFPEDAPVAVIGHKALAVNLSDLAAMGAEPAWATLSLTLPQPDAAWLEAFAGGLDALARAHDVALVGGDLCRGPLSMTLQITGFVPADKALRRAGARVGDHVVVSGTLGDAALGLRYWQAGEQASDDQRALAARLHRPTPRVALGRGLRGLASACIDLSDGLVSDLDHLLTASGVGASLNEASLPVSDAARRVAGVTAARQAALTGGDDYELCFTVPDWAMPALSSVAADTGSRLSVIGRVVSGSGLCLADGRSLPAEASGYRHF